MLLMLLALLYTTLSLTTHSDLINVINTPGGTDKEPLCAVTCAGVGSWNGTGTYYREGWKDTSDFPGKSFLSVDTRNCSFVSAPVITTSVVSELYAICPPLSLKAINDGSAFFAYTYENVPAETMNKNKCDVHWSAFGCVNIEH